MVANRSVGTGLTESAVIFSTALLGAPYLTYWYGIALPVWWANGQSTMICAFGWLAIQAKLKAPNAHTLLELIKVRYGYVAHIIWIILCLINNILNFSSMLVGASTAVSSLTGMNIVASTYLLPLGVMVYTYFGDIRATFLTDYVHTFIIMIILVWFTIKVLTIQGTGSIGALYDAVLPLSKQHPVEGNYQGSYLTMTSKESISFGIIHIVTNFGIVFLDTGFWQKVGIVVHTHKHLRPPTDIESRVLPRKWQRPFLATFLVERLFCHFKEVCSQTNALSSPATFPTAFALVWKRQTRATAIISPLIGMACGLAVWVGTAYGLYGEATIKTLGMTLPCLYGNLTSSFWSDLLTIKRVEDDDRGQVGATATHFNADVYFSPDRVAYMKRVSRIAVYWGIATFAGQVVLWPLPMYGARFVFSKGLFVAWIVVSLIWLCAALFVANFYPLVDGGLKKIWIVVSGKKDVVVEKGLDDGSGSGGGVSSMETTNTPPGETEEIVIGGEKGIA
ncbi:uncharacterized protein Z518_07078 [Rhinocladiella mackenziei CBS 650.93]|uniref:Uncharacterized protein n=1 Tax=Rhinocladiella mackenziei CBS 650.93 TaxID=1442369 RepID=A0A0D2J3K8_9EURO|nr:uncharacterized protein Z518_07078 [Rhinocladiella mackenziei CBS 650.93]KIX03525.1 hypothetical protein Z518_07078 [Rhinocladiella mackenziei CBS 650.93]